MRTANKKINWSNIWHAIGMTISVALALFGIFFLVPWLIGGAPNIFLGILAMILVVPIIPAVSVILQGDQKPSLSNLFILYFLELMALTMQEMVLVIYLPFMLAWVGLIMGLVVVLIFVILLFTDSVSGTTSSVVGLIIGAAVMLLSFLIIRYGEKYLDKFMFYLMDKTDQLHNKIWQNMEH